MIKEKSLQEVKLNIMTNGLFSEFLKYLSEAESKMPEGWENLFVKKQSMSTATTEKSRDAARKRAERASKPKKSQLPKSELLKQILPVQTATGSVELIYKDSYNSKYHKIIDPQTETTLEKAQSITKEPKFHTNSGFTAIVRIFGKESCSQTKKREKEAVAENQPSADMGPEPVPQQFTKPKKMSIDDLIASLWQNRSCSNGINAFRSPTRIFLAKQRSYVR
jgi:hypothetical protein